MLLAAMLSAPLKNGKVLGIFQPALFLLDSLPGLLNGNFGVHATEILNSLLCGLQGVCCEPLKELHALHTRAPSFSAAPYCTCFLFGKLDCSLTALSGLRCPLLRLHDPLLEGFCKLHNRFQ